MKLHNYAKRIKKTFSQKLLNNVKDFVNNPKTNFTRNSKLSPKTVILFLFQCSNRSIKNELLENEINVKRQTMTNAISKFTVSAFQKIFLDSLNIRQKFKTFHGYRQGNVNLSALKYRTSIW